MTKQFSHRALAVLLAASAATAASADLTADDVWGDWRSAMEDTGLTLSVTSESRLNGTLTISGLTFSTDYAEGSLEGTVGEIVFEERGDGSVGITMSPEIPVSFQVEPEEGGEGSFTMVITQTDAMTVAAGDPDDLTYTYEAPLIALSVIDLVAEQDPMDMTITAEVTGNRGLYRVAAGDVRSIASTFSADTMSINMRGQEPGDGGGMFDLSMSMTDLESSSNGTMPAMAAMTDLPAMVAAGFETEGTFTHGPLVYAMAGRDDASSFGVTGTTNSGALDFAIGPQGLSYGGSNTGVEISISSSDIPFPAVNLSMSESAGRITMPITVSEEPQDVGLLMVLRDLVVDEAIWAMFDPAGALPRDPATLVIDVSGQANWLVDVMNPEVAEELEPGTVPGELHALDVNELRLSIAGAELTGDGAFTFDNGDLETFDGLPAPSGVLNLMLVGANGLIDNLVMMGIVPEDQAMGARMMLGLFARPGNGPDTLVSTIEVQPDGAVLANGQRIR